MPLLVRLVVVNVPVQPREGRRGERDVSHVAEPGPEIDPVFRPRVIEALALDHEPLRRGARPASLLEIFQPLRGRGAWQIVFQLTSDPEVLVARNRNGAAARRLCHVLDGRTILTSPVLREAANVHSVP